MANNNFLSNWQKWFANLKTKVSAAGTKIKENVSNAVAQAKEKAEAAKLANANKTSATPTAQTDATTAANAVDNKALQTEGQNNDRFLSWYKEQFGKDYVDGSFNKTEGMSDKDYETGNNLYQAYIQKQNLENQYNSATKAVDDSKAAQRQEASILRDKMSKYLNLQNKNNGLNNLGVSESVGLQADSQYMNNLGNIEANANNEKTNLFNNYMTNKTNIESDTAANEQNILNKYQQFEREDEQKAYDREQDAYNKQKAEEQTAYDRAMDEYNKQKYEDQTAYDREQDAYNKQKAEEQTAYDRQNAAQTSAFNEFMGIVESGTFNTAAELEEFYNSFKNQLSPSQQAIAEQQIKFYKNNPDQQQMDSATESSKPVITDNGDGSQTSTVDNGDGTVTETKTDQNGNKETSTKLKIDTSTGHNRYVSKGGVTISSPMDNHLNITYGSNNNDHANNYDITYNGEKYKVEVGDEFAGSNDELQEIYAYMRQTSGRNDIREGDCVLYNGQLYIASSTGRLWTIQNRSKFWAWNWGGKTASDLNDLFKTNFG